jgi:apolipoprotein N-acyltransferase
MKLTSVLFSKFSSYLTKNPSLYLIFGIILMTMTHLRFNVAVLAWICMVPFLYFLKLESVRYKTVKFILALFIAWSLIVSKIITDPIPLFLVLMYSVPITLIHLPAYLIWSRIRTSKWNGLLFPAVIVVMEWVQYTFTPLGSWGSLAYTQVGQHAILQSLSLFGIAGLSFVIYSFNVWITALLSQNSSLQKQYKWMIPVVLLLLVYGEVRLEHFNSSNKEMLKLAAIGTDSEAGGLPLPSEERNKNDFLEVLRRTQKAAEAGAEIAVWTEAAFFMEPSYESAWVDSIKATARQSNINIVASYVNVISVDPLLFENKYQLITSDGEVEREYNKHEPVPGEPAIKGKEVFAVSNLNGYSLGGAICYDYDFPYIARAFGNLNADIVALPSSDWRGIDPLHTRMAAFRSVEQGHSILRSTRFGLSAAVNPIGMFMAKMSSYNNNDAIMIANLPRKGVKTLYSIIGDIVVYMGMVYLLWLGVTMVRLRKSRA